MITFQVESWASYYGDPSRESLWLEHYKELEPAHLGLEAMSPDVASYEALDRAGSLLVVCARESGRLVGYCLVVCRRHLHYPTFCGFEDSYYLTPSARKGSVGIRLFKETLRELTRRGCKKSYWMTKEFASVGRIFQYLGMTKMDEVWVHKIGAG